MLKGENVRKRDIERQKRKVRRLSAKLERAKTDLGKMDGQPADTKAFGEMMKKARDAG